MLKKRLIALFAVMILLLSGCAGANVTTTVSVNPSPSPEVTATPTQTIVPTPTPEVGCKNLVLIIGDGMGAAHIDAAQKAYGEIYGFTGWQSALIDTNALDENGEPTKITDSAAASTAMATGVLTNRRKIGIDPEGNNLTTFLDLAKEKGMLTGILTTETLLGATPSGFSAHVKSRYDEEGIFASQLTSGVDLLCGAPDELCKSGISQITQSGYEYCDDAEGLKSISATKQYWQFDTLNPPKNSPSFDELAIIALDYLYSRGNFILVIEQAHIDKFCHDNAFAETLHSVSMLNTAVERVTAWAEGKNTAVMVLSDHETGGLIVSEDAKDKYYSIVTGREIGYEYTSDNHTDTLVNIFVKGFTADFASLPYFKSEEKIKNSDVFHLVCDLLKLSENQPES